MGNAFSGNHECDGNNIIGAPNVATPKGTAGNSGTNFPTANNPVVNQGNINLSSVKFTPNTTVNLPNLSNYTVLAENYYKGTMNVNNMDVNNSINIIPRGIIIAFNGTDIPYGWALCDGTNGTPDLRGRFILGYNPTQQTDGSGSSRKPRDMNAIGGNEQLIANIGFHWWPGGDWDNGLMYDAIKDVGFNVLNDNTSSGLVMINAGKQYLEMTSHEDIKNHNRKSSPRPVSVTGKNTTESLPPYYVLAYIMKL